MRKVSADRMQELKRAYRLRTGRPDPVGGPQARGHGTEESAG